MLVDMVSQFVRVDLLQNGEMVRRDFFCHREGSQPLKVVDLFMKQRNRSSTKCGCKAYLRISLKKFI